MSLAINEQETHISFMRGDETCHVYVSDTTMLTKMDKLVEKNPEEYTVVKETAEGKTYEMPVRLLSFRTRSKKLTEEQRRKLSERARQNFH